LWNDTGYSKHFHVLCLPKLELSFDLILHLNILNIRHLGQKNSVCILLIFWCALGKGKEIRKLSGKKKSPKMTRKRFLTFNSIMNIKFGMSEIDLAFSLLISCTIPDQF
jgi:hypothetical protein